MMLQTSRSSTRALASRGVVNAVLADTRKTIKIKASKAKVKARASRARARAMVADTDAPVVVVDKTAPTARIADAIPVAKAADLWVPWTTATATRTERPRRETASAMALPAQPIWSRC